jgi:hypothetical protein
MKKLVALCILTVALTGCGREDPLIKVEYRDRVVGVNAIPAPPEYTKPQSIFDTLTPEQRTEENTGLMVKALVADRKADKGYIDVLERIVNKYKDEAAKNTVPVEPLKVPGVNAPLP